MSGFLHRVAESDSFPECGGPEHTEAVEEALEAVYEQHKPEELVRLSLE